MRITLKNYRCFPDTRPAEFEIRPGFTAFLGTNNSGKSALLKFFHEFRDLFARLSDFSSEFRSALTDRGVFAPSPSISDLSEVFCNTNERDLTLEFALDARPAPDIPSRIVITVPRGTNTFAAKFVPTPPIDLPQLNFRESTLDSNTGQRVVELAPYFTEFKALSQAFYIGPFRNAINVGTNADYFDIRVGQAFIQHWRGLKTGASKQQNEFIMKVSEDIAHIFDYRSLQIDASHDEKTLQIFIDNKSYKLPELGSGLTQFILVLGNAAIRKPTFIMIDEPELNLHPSLMLDFLTSLASYSSVGVVFSTHSFGLARAAADRIYSLRKIAEGETEVRAYEATPRLSEFLGELSFSGYRELGFEKILLVEGRTDVPTVQQFLRLYKMDHKIVLLPLGGRSLINGAAAQQLEEIKRISPSVSALIDSECSAPGQPLAADRQAFVAACSAAGITCHVLERRATENYFPDRAIKQTKGHQYSALTPFETLGSTAPSWRKTENWRIARAMTLAELNSTDLGTFLARLCST